MEWLSGQLDGSTRVGFPWQSLFAFVRISTHPRISPHPLTSTEAWGIVEDWIDADVTWIPTPGPRYGEIVGELIGQTRATGNLVTDLQLAALGIENGSAICSADADFSKFMGVECVNPFA